ncbi:MAG: heparan-alpha-glucosaminide N-acetyltransferase [Salaquimonas sp.]
MKLEKLSTNAHKPSRLAVLDLTRGLALVAMTLFHFGWDLEMFGFVGSGFASQPSMVWFARCIASTFLFLVGFSLFLAHHKGINWPSFIKRLLMVFGAALIITIATWFATPDIFIFFGILHNITLASLLGLLFLRVSAILNVLAAVVVLALFWFAKSNLFDAPYWWWTGLNAFTPRSSDYVPIFPFFAAVLLGMAASKITLANGWIESWSQIKSENGPSRLLQFIGRHSLVYYLVHQPIMIAILYMFHLLIR